jgi:hypothetical protein
MPRYMRSSPITGATMIITDTVAIMNKHPRKTLRPPHPALAVLLMALMPAVLCTPAGTAQSNGLDVFAKCLADRKATMYGSFLCPHCDDQKKLFGPSFKYVPYIECSVPGTRQMTFLCVAAQIRYTPTWIFADNERRTGIQSLKDLSAKTECPLP